MSDNTKLTFSEVDSQEYSGNNCIFSAGLVSGHPVDRIYISWSKDGAEEITLCLRPDEAARFAALLSNALWSHLLTPIHAESPVDNP